MADMNVSLTRELDRLIQQKVKSGMYQTASEVVREALRLLRERDDVRAGLAQIDRGEYDEYDQHSVHGLAAQVKARGMRRSAPKRKAG
jgi:antitoxin ParD1/3/4